MFSIQGLPLGVHVLGVLGMLGVLGFRLGGLGVKVRLRAQIGLT